MKLFWLLLSVQFLKVCHAQPYPKGISSPFTMQTERDKLKRQLYNRTTGENFQWDARPSNAYRYQSAFWAVSQFMIYNPSVEAGFEKTLLAYDSLDTETRRSFLEALYTVQPTRFQDQIIALLPIEKNPKLFAMAALFVWRNDRRQYGRIRELLDQRLQEYPEHPILLALAGWIEPERHSATATPDINSLFEAAKKRKQKTVYSFQRWNRDYPGMTIIQDSTGHFVRDSLGKLVTIRQLARAASNLPYFITNGNTPQGIYSIQGSDTSMNHFIGPTTNLQLILPFERDWDAYFHGRADSIDPSHAYADLLPENWRQYPPIWEAFDAGRAGRNEIIAHGTTIDPTYFKGKPYFPISPTLGCLCAPEEWNASTGTLTRSEQFRLMHYYVRARGSDGYLYVINLSREDRPVSAAELDQLVNRYELSIK